MHAGMWTECAALTVLFVVLLRVQPFDAHRTDGRVSDRDNEYTARRLARGFSPVRKDAFAEEMESSAPQQPKTKKAKAAAAAAAAAAGGQDENVRTYKDIMMEQQLAREEAVVLKNIEKKRVEEEARKAAGLPSSTAAAAAASSSSSSAAAAAAADSAATRKRRRWGDGEDGSATKAAPELPSSSSESLLDSSENWAAAPQRNAEEEDEEETEEDAFAEPGAPPKELNSWDATPVNLPSTAAAAPGKKRSRWDQSDATPLSASLSSAASSSAADATPLHIPSGAGDATPLYNGGVTPIASSLLAGADSAMGGAAAAGTGPGGMSTPLHMTSDQWKAQLEAMTPDQLQALRLEAEIAARNQPLSDDELDALLPGEKDGFVILVPPESYKPIRTPARKLLQTPMTPFGTEGFFIPIDAPGIKYEVPPSPAESGLPAFQKEEDSKYFGALLEEVDEARLTPTELKERRIMKLLLKIKNGTPPQRKTALRAITDKAREFGAAPLFDQILPLLMSPTLEDGERHMLVKVIDRILYKLDDLVRPYVHKILIVIEPMLIEDDFYARVEGREIISNLAKAAGLATMIATMRPDIDNQDEYVSNKALTSHANKLTKQQRGSQCVLVISNATVTRTDQISEIHKTNTRIAHFAPDTVFSCSDHLVCPCLFVCLFVCFVCLRCATRPLVRSPLSRLLLVCTVCCRS